MREAHQGGAWAHPAGDGRWPVGALYGVPIPRGKARGRLARLVLPNLKGCLWRAAALSGSSRALRGRSPRRPRLVPRRRSAVLIFRRATISCRGDGRGASAGRSPRAPPVPPARADTKETVLCFRKSQASSCRQWYKETYQALKCAKAPGCKRPCPCRDIARGLPGGVGPAVRGTAVGKCTNKLYASGSSAMTVTLAEAFKDFARKLSKACYKAYFNTHPR